MKVEQEHAVVRSVDGTVIAYETVGSGPPVLLVGGAFNDRRARAAGLPLAELLSHAFTVAASVEWRQSADFVPRVARRSAVIVPFVTSGTARHGRGVGRRPPTTHHATVC